MEKRREDKEKRLKSKEEEVEKYCQECPKIQQQFSDLKEELHLVSEEEWRNIPEAIPHARNRNKRNARLERTYDNDEAAELYDKQMEKSREDGENQLKLAEEKYCQERPTIQQQYSDEDHAAANDEKKARFLLKSVCETYSNHPPDCIASAHLEEVTGKLQAVHNLILQGCETCPESEADAARQLVMAIVDYIIDNSVNSLDSNEVKIPRDQWPKEAVDAEAATSIYTCQATIKDVIGHGVEDEDRKHTSLEVADA